MPTSRLRKKIARAAVAYVSAVATTIPLFVFATPVAAVTSERARTALISDGTIEIDGPPVTIELVAGETAELDFEWDASRRVFFWWSSCSNMHVRTFSTYALPSIDFACGINEDPTPTWHGDIPLDRNRLGDPGPHIMTFQPFDADGGSDPASVTVRLTSQPPPPDAGPITPGGDPLALGSTGRYGAVWVSFTAEQGDDLTLRTLDGACDARYRVRRPDGRILADQSTHGIDGCTEGVYPAWDLGELPVTGTYRIEVVSGVLGMASRNIQLTFNSAPDVCLGYDITPIMLVHGFNGTSNAWRTFEPALVDRIGREFVRKGLPVEDSIVCGRVFVRSVNLGGRASSHENAFLLAAEINEYVEQTGSDLLDIIAHSKGGLDTRRTIRLMGPLPPVRNLLMIGTPNGGTPLADVGCGIYSSPLEIASDYIEEEFGQCDGPEDALFGITEEFVRKTFNLTVLNNTAVVYQVISGASTCNRCRVLGALGMSHNDSLVPVSSVELYAPWEHNPVGQFDATHSDLLHNSSVISRAHCSLTGRTPHPTDCVGEQGEATNISPTADAATNMTPALMHFDALEIPGGGVGTITLPIGGVGPAEIALLVDQVGLTATIGTVELEPEPTERGEALTTVIENSTDLELTIDNPGSENATGLILVAGTGIAPLEIDTPAVVDPDSPIDVTVPGIESLAGLTGSVVSPSGTRTDLTFTADGPDAVATFTPTESGDHLATAFHAARFQRTAVSHFGVATAGASLPGSFTESLEMSSDGLVAISLHLDVDVAVAEPGTYRLAGGLTTAGGVQVATAEASAELTGGPQVMRLTVPGSLLYAAGEDGPYHLALTLLRLDPNGGPETIEAQLAGSSLTEPYLADSFRPAAITAGHVPVEQGSFDTVVAEVPVTLSEAVTRPVTVSYASLNPPGDQYAHSPDDFQAVAGTLTFLPGETTKNIEVTINGNPEQEGNKLAVIELANPTSAAVGGDGQGGVAILNEPTAVIDTPGSSLTWSTGDEVSFSGHVNDPVAGLLPPSALNWALRLEHCPPPPDLSGCHTHVLQEWNGVANGSFTAPDHGYPAHLELELTADGTSGLTHRTSHELHPNTVDLTLTSNPPGLQLAAGFPPALFLEPTPFTRTAIQGSTVLLGALDQTEDGTTYLFHQWSQGGPASQSIQAPTIPTTYTATFATDLVQIDPPSTAAGQYPAVAAAFGPPPTELGLAGDVVLVNDASPNPTEGCNPLVGFPAGAIALIDRGTCSFTQKVRNAANAGATAVIVVNNQPGDPFVMGGTDPAITIPSVMLSLDNGNTIMAGLPATSTILRVVPADTLGRGIEPATPFPI